MDQYFQNGPIYLKCQLLSGMSIKLSKLKSRHDRLQIFEFICL